MKNIISTNYVKILSLFVVAFFLPSFAQAGTQTFNANDTFVVPTGVTTISVTASAGGGGGSNPFGLGDQGGYLHYNGGGGGSGGNISNVSYTVVPGSSLPVSVGGPGIYATNGGDTSISSLFTLTGGLSAYAQQPASPPSQVGSGGNPNGQAGGGHTCAGSGGSYYCSPVIRVGGNGGGNSVGGVGGSGGTADSCAPGAGTRGSGGGGQAYSCFPGGLAAGGAGFVTITWLDPTVGTINVSSNIAGASWTITGPATLNGSGASASYASQPTGTYAITWGPVPGYTTPSSAPQTLTNAGTLSFSGNYVTPSVNLFFSQLLQKIKYLVFG